MKKIKRKHLSISAKIISIFYIILITMFVFDEKIFSLGFFIHLIPTMIFLGCLVVAWFKPQIGGIFFMTAGLGTIIFFNTYREIFTLIVISLIPIITGILFFLSKKK
jgi:hypothetical protein